jgi:glycosyltransferase involved in cell wall biosynthesis
MAMKPKILILGKLPPPYMGPAIATEIILKSKLRERYQLLHLDTRVNDSLVEMGRWSIKKLFRYLNLYVNMLGLILKEKPSLVLIPISQSTIGFLKDSILILIARLTGRKTIVQLRGSNFQTWQKKSSAITRAVVKFILSRTQGVIVLGENLRYLFESIFPSNKIYVCPNGGNYDLDFQLKENEKIRILYFANLQSSKGIEDVIEAIAVLKKKTGNFILDVVGQWRSDQVKEVCIRKVKEENIPVIFHPPASGKEKLAFFEKADIFVFTPREPEGHPWVIVEAMAAGLPVISTDQGAIIESIQNGENGYIVGVRDPQMIAERLEELILNKPLRERMGKTSRALYEQKFTEDKMVENLSGIFEQVLAA